MAKHELIKPEEPTAKDKLAAKIASCVVSIRSLRERNQPGRIRLKGYELQQLLQFIGCETVMNDPDLDSYIRQLPYGAQKMGVIRGNLGRLIYGIMDMLPTDQLLRLEKMLPRTKVWITTETSSLTNYDKTHGSFLTYEMMNVLTNYALRECSVCTASQKEIRECPLRKTLLELDYKAKETQPGICPFMFL